MFCTHCGKDLPSGVRFCTGCGAPVSEPVKPAQSMFQEAPSLAPDAAPAPQPSVPYPEQPFYVEPQVDSAVPPVYEAPSAYAAVHEPAPEAKPKRKRRVWPLVVTLCVLLLAGAVCAVLLVPALHDAVFGVEELSFSKNAYTLSVDDKLDLTEDLDTGDRAKSDLEWSSSDEDVATVNKNGVVTAVGPGECKITVEDKNHDDVYDEVSVTVTAPQPLRFSESSYELTVGDKLDLTDDLDAGDRKSSDLKWSSSDEDVVTVKNGVITAVGPGDCKITVEDKKDGDISDSVRVTVEDEETFRFRSDSVTLQIGDTFDIAEELIIPGDDLDGLSISVSDAEVTAFSYGLVLEAVKPGESTVYASKDGAFAQVTITVEGSTDDIDVEAELANIRSWYYSPGGNDVLSKVKSGEGGWDAGREYLFHDGELVFAYVYDDADEYRLYFKDGKLFYALDTDRNEYTGDELTRFRSIADKVKSDALDYEP